jgi:hypothetical protein
MFMSKSLAKALVLVFLMACVMIAKPVSRESAAGNSWVEKALMDQNLFHPRKFFAFFSCFISGVFYGNQNDYQKSCTKNSTIS